MMTSIEQNDLDEVKMTYPDRYWAQSPYPWDKDINERVSLFQGNIESLKADLIVNPTNEHLTQLDYVSDLAGPELEEFIRKRIRYCPTGDALLTPGFASNFDYIIHAVPPKYKSKYKTAAETALYHAYFRVIEIMIERRLRTCVIPMLTTSASIKDNLPLEDHIHIQLRLLRRILEKKRHDFDRITLHMSSNGYDDQEELEMKYKLLFRCYFPSRDLDEELACHVLDCDCLGGPNGEPIVLERQIRIKNWRQESTIDLKTGLDLSTVVGKTAFSKMQSTYQPTLQQQQPPQKNAPRRQKSCVLL